MTGRWLLGDALTAELRNIRLSPSSAEFDEGLTRLDLMLDAAGTTPVNASTISRGIRAVAAPVLHPMTLRRKDFALAMRILRALQFAKATSLFITSADAIGYGYGVLVSPDGDVRYYDRVSRQRLKDAPASFNPSMLTKAPNAIARCAAALETDSNGLTITFSNLPEETRLRTDFSSSVAYRGTDGSLKIDSFHSLDLSLNRTPEGVVIGPKTPESTIRLASIATGGAVIRISGSFDVVARLELSGTGDQSIDAFYHSGAGPLREWLNCPPLPYALLAEAETNKFKEKV